MSVLNAISDFFVAIFFPHRDKGNIRELRTARQTLRECRPTIYRSTSKQVLPAFAQAIFNLTKQLKPLVDLLEKNLLIQDQRIARRYWDWLLETYLGERGEALLERLEYENLVKRFTEAPDRKALVAEVQREGSEILKMLSDPNLAVADIELSTLERVVDMVRYDYVRILRHFSTPETRTQTLRTQGLRTQQEGKRKFRAGDGEILAADLAELYSVLAGVEFSPGVQKNLISLAQRQGKSHMKALEKRLPRLSAQVHQLLAGALSERTLSALLVLIKEDGNYNPPAPVQPAGRLAQYRDRFSRRFTDDIDRIQREIRESALSSEISALFNTSSGGGLVAVASYNEDLNTRLQTELGISLKYTLPFRLLKTFERRFLGRDFIDACKRIVIEGFFNNTLFRSRMTDAIGKVEKMQVRLDIFEESTTTQGRTSSAMLRRAIDEFSKGRALAESVERIAGALDQRAKELLEQELIGLRELAEFIHDVIADFKRPSPNLVVNIKVLASAKEKNLIPTLLEGYNASARLLRIMKSFLVIVPITTADTIV